MQDFAAPLTRHAIFLVVRAAPGATALAALRDVLGDLSGTLKTVSFRDPDADLSCTVGIGSDLWPRLTGLPRPAELRPFEPLVGGVHTAVATPGDLLFHIRSDRADLCFEFERILLDALGGSAQVVEETACFRYFDRRDLLGFVDGTANPAGSEIVDAVVVGDEDPLHTGGSYILAQKYLHPIHEWQALPAEAQEAIMGRTKPDNIELDDAASGQKSHKTLATIVDDQGTEHDILRDNMPFGSPGSDEFGTYFIGYSRHRWVLQRMLERMFIGDPVGLHDRLLDFSTATTGTAFFAPRADVLAGLPDVTDAMESPTGYPESDNTPPAPVDSSLGIGGRN